MGGKSTGGLSYLDSGGIVFKGNINLDGGGFSSIRRTLPSLDLSGHAGVVIEFEPASEAVGPALGVHLQLGGRSAAFAIPPKAASRGAVDHVFLPMGAFVHTGRWSRQQDLSRISEVSVYVLYQEGAFEVRLLSIVAVENEQAPASAAVLAPPLSWDMDSNAVAALIKRTIARGAVLYDKGYQQLCRAVYDETARIIAQATGPSKPVKRMLGAAHMVAEAHYPLDDGIGAWALRRAFDAVLAVGRGDPVPAEARYPQSVHGVWLAEGPVGNWTAATASAAALPADKPSPPSNASPPSALAPSSSTVRDAASSGAPSAGNAKPYARDESVIVESISGAGAAPLGRAPTAVVAMTVAAIATALC